MKKVGVIDYGCGNLFSLEAGLVRSGLSPIRVKHPQDAENCAGLILPGVGSFAAGMRGLLALELSDYIKEWFAADRPLLGICLGMQLMLEGSEEACGIQGLSLVPGVVRRLWGPFAVPHMGWNYVQSRQGDLLKEGFYYFVHSYYAELTQSECIVGETIHNLRIPAALKSRNTWGLQFHPEKSGQQGLRILREWGEKLA